MVPSGPPAQPPPTTTTPPTQGPVTEDHVDDWLSRHPVLGAPVNLLAGIGAGAEESVAGVDALGRRITGTKMTGAEQTLQREAAKETQGTMQQIGKGAEGVGEFFTGEELLGMLGRSGQVMSAAQKLKAATGLANIANEIPMIGKLMRIGMNVVRTGTVSGAQEYAKTGGDMSAAGVTGGITGAGEAALGAAGLGMRALADVAPIKRVIEGVPITALKSQINKFGRFIPGSAEGLAPKIAEQQQQAAQQVLENVAAKATGTAVDEVNVIRDRVSPYQDPMGIPGSAPAPQGPPVFKVGTAAPTELHPAMEDQMQTDRATIEGLLDKFANPSMRKTITPEEKEAWDAAHQRLYNFPEAMEGGQSTPNPAEAVKWLQDREDAMNSANWKDVDPAKQTQIQDEVKQLRDQLGAYHSGYRQPLAQIDRDAITSQVQTFGHGEAQLRAIAQPVLDEVGSLAKDRTAMTGLQEELKNAQSAIITAKDSEGFDSGLSRYRKANQGIQQLLDRHSGAIAPADYEAATKTLSQASKLGELHAVFEHMMNGVTHEESEEGLSRVMTGNAKRLQGWLDKTGNTEMLDSLVGKQTRTNLKEMTLLMSKASSNRNSAAAAKEIANYVLQQGKHYGVVSGAGAIAGGLLAPLFGMSPTQGAFKGAGMAAGMRLAYRLAATNPRVGRTLVWAVNHGADPKNYMSMFLDALPRAVAEPMRQEGQLATPEEIQQAQQAAQAQQGGGTQ